MSIDFEPDKLYSFIASNGHKEVDDDSLHAKTNLTKKKKRKQITFSQLIGN